VQDSGDEDALTDGKRRKAPLYLGFAATGVALTLPGALLPVLLRRWSLGDARGGALLGCFFASATLGSLGARGRMHRAVAAGALAIAMGALALAGAGSGAANAAYLALAVYGAGLGLMITATGLLMSRRFPATRRVEMVRLNLVWAMGAACGPWVALHSTHVGTMFLEVAAFFLAAAGWAWWMEGGKDWSAVVAAQPGVSAQAGAEGVSRRWGTRTMKALAGVFVVPWPLLLLLFLDTGVEASINGWLTAYAQRAGDALGTTIGAATLLWVGVLISRAIHATPWALRLPERAVLMSSLAAMAGALAMLVARPAGAVTLVAAALLGLAAGPVYPLVVTAALRRREDAGIFVIGGLGSASLPLLTGAVSAGMHSLRWGLGVPLVAAVGMVVLAKAGIRDKG
jgi:fucose permease